MIPLPTPDHVHALFMGSISTLVDTSEMQRHAFNAAFKEAGLDWHWSGNTYRDKLTRSGGKARIVQEAAERGEDIDAADLHARKTRIFQDILRSGAFLRPGVAQALSQAKARGGPIAFISGTHGDSVALVEEIVAKETGLSFDLTLSADHGLAPKPAPALYEHALSTLGLPARAVIAVEDNGPGVRSAVGAGISTLGFPNANTRAEDLHGAFALVTGGLDEALADSLGPLRTVA